MSIRLVNHVRFAPSTTVSAIAAHLKTMVQLPSETPILLYEVCIHVVLTTPGSEAKQIGCN